jgi:hypothetical protein
MIDDVPLAWTMELKRRAGHRKRMKPVVEAGRLTMAHDFGWFGEWEWERDKRNEIQKYRNDFPDGLHVVFPNHQSSHPEVLLEPEPCDGLYIRDFRLDLKVK